ncbi:MAG TPA: hypothetical protein VLN08_03780 [Vicinamibacterales bacterium]|nr:hypothetical protein [Vicinamibacterales bacterium]
MTKRYVLIALLAFVVALPAMAIAQTPNFTGKWTQDMEKSDPPMGGGRGPGGPQSLTITQTATEITLERETPNGVMKTVYKLDGSPSVNAMGRGGEVTSKSAWEGGKLVTKYSRTMGQTTVEVTETRSLEADGTMTVVSVTKGGPQGDMTRKMVFKKA